MAAKKRYKGESAKAFGVRKKKKGKSRVKANKAAKKRYRY